MPVSNLIYSCVAINIELEEYDKAIVILKDMIARRNTLKVTQVEIAEALGGIGVAYAKSHRYNAAIRYLEQSLFVYEIPFFREQLYEVRELMGLAPFGHKIRRRFKV